MTASVYPLRVVRSVLAFVLPALLGTLVLLLGLICRRQPQARRLNTWLVGHLGPWLAGFSIDISGEVAALACRPLIIAFNHQSGVDPVIMARLAGRDSIGLAKRALKQHLLLGPLLRMQGALFVDQNESNQNVLETAAERIRRHRLALLVAPEGKRSLSLARFRSGATRLSAMANAPIVPVVIHNSGDILAPGALVMRPGCVRVTVLPAQAAGSLGAETLRALFVQALGRGDNVD